MKVLRLRFFSNYALERMITKITERLDRDRISDYEVTERVPNDVVSVFLDPKGIKVYLPGDDYEYFQYDLDDYIRSIAPYIRTNTNPERDLYVMRLSGGGMLSEAQLYKLVRYIIEETGFVSLVSDKEQ